MATQRQIEANRLNAQQSSGPRSDAGKLASSRNSLKFGLDAESQFLPGESPQEFAELQAAYNSRFRPQSPEDQFQVDKLVRSEWLLRRFFRVEVQLWEYQVSQCGPESPAPLGEAFAKASHLFMRLQRRVSAAEKAYKEASIELRRLQQQQAPPPPLVVAAPQPQQNTPPTPKLGSFRNFIHPELATLGFSPLRT